MASAVPLHLRRRCSAHPALEAFQAARAVPSPPDCHGSGIGSYQGGRGGAGHGVGVGRAAGGRAISVPLTSATGALSRLLADAWPARSGPIDGQNGQIPKLMVRVFLPPAGPQAQGWTGKCNSSRCQYLAEVGSSSRYPEGGRRREDEPPGGVRVRTNRRTLALPSAHSSLTDWLSGIGSGCPNWTVHGP